MTGLCETCSLWDRAGPDWEFETLKLGKCQGVRFRYSIREEALVGKGPGGEDLNQCDPEGEAAIEAAMQAAKAWVTDASGYSASLFTKADFGCVLHAEST